MAPTERNRRAAGLDGLRAVAALSVVCFHVWLYGFPNPSGVTRDSFADYALFEGRLGLVFFFVLSGYLLYRGFARAALEGDRSVDVRRYARRRFARIVPAYYLATLGAIALLWGGAGTTPGIRLPAAEDLPLYAFFAQNFSADTIMRLNPVTWTLCVEAAFYILLPLIGWLAWRIGPRATWRQALLIGSLILLGIGWNAFVRDNGWNMIASKALPAFLPYFACGMLLALWAETRRRRGASDLSAAATAALFAAGVAIVGADAVWHATAPPRAGYAPLVWFADVPAAIGFALVVAAAVAGRGPAVRWMALRPLAWVGLVSYGVYMWHLPLLLFMHRVGVMPDGFVLGLLLLMVPTLLVSAVSWYLVERPLIAWAGRPRGREQRADEQHARSRAPRELEARAAP
jgi:peptidoglycan/LPS O-acetylase OafA/YrhL